MSQNTLIVLHKRRHTISYNLCVSNLALRAIRFKFCDRLKHHLIGFQSVTPETVQNDECFYAYRRSVALGPITCSTRSMQGVDTWTYARPMRQRISKSKGLPIDIHLCFYYFQHAHRHIKKNQGATDRRTSLLLLLSACTSPRTKTKGLSIDAPYNFYYFSYTHSAAHKKQGAP
jgi:hypothetical protein